MSIGKPKRVIHLEPLTSPVPRSAPVLVPELGPACSVEPAELFTETAVDGD